MEPLITVVMPVRNEARFIRETLMQLLVQDYPSDRFEIIVTDGMSVDGTQAIVQELANTHKQIRLLENPKMLSSSGRNIGFKNGKGDYFIVVDGHCHIPDDQLLRNVVHCFDISGADCLGRSQPLDPPGLTIFQLAIAMARASWLGHGGDSLIYGRFEGYASPTSNGAVYKRCIFDKVGYVDESFDACEDLEHNYRVEKAGIKAYASPKLTVRYYPRENYTGLFRQMVRYGRGRFRFIRKHPEALTLNQLAPAGFVIGLILLIFVGLVSIISSHWSQVTGPLSVIYVIYGVLVLVQSFRLAGRSNWGCISALPLIFFTIHFGLGYGFIAESLKSILLWKQMPK